MKLYGSSVSPFYERCLIALEMKNALDAVQYPGFPPGGMKSDAHFKGHPYGKIPYLELDDDTCLIEGQVIMEYLDGVVGGPTLTPADPYDRARASLIGRIVDTYIFPHQGKLSGNVIFGYQDPEGEQNAIEKGIPDAIKALERYIGDGPNVIGDSWSTGDAALIPYMFHAQLAKDAFGFDVLADHKVLAAWWGNVQDTAIVQNCMARMQKSFEYLQAAMAD
ncbi:glutathione S-transferase [Kordiimonas sediminis]|uniref:Glutathione S-transferase n=1 Tax=Kordiimonas sediminis TaxID=1735581 RepID=A0A919AT52_9PROT|nr:glutathione S-transferase family protein [Kordiimonas sediminis]GHF24022.1 glutathione S-transferase [Kordiimonas sediminis]